MTEGGAAVRPERPGVMSELAKRWAVAGVGIPTVLGLFYLGGWYLALPLAIFAVLATLECYRLAAAKGMSALTWIGATTSAGLVACAAWQPTYGGFAPVALALLAAAAVVSLVASLAVRGPERKPLGSVAVTLFGSLYGGLSLSFALLLSALPAVDGWAGSPPVRGAGLMVVALPLAATWVGDASAFFAGTAWGKSKLAPSISPNKSWIGFWGNLIGAAAAAAVWYRVAEPRLPSMDLGGIWVVAVMGASLGLAAVIGDLVESLLKREAGVKDSGTFFPGHGGVLDRIDSLVFTIPLAYVALRILGGPS